MQGCVCTRSHGLLPLTAHVGGSSLDRGPWTHGAWERGREWDSGTCTTVEADVGCGMCVEEVEEVEEVCRASRYRRRERRKRSREAYAGADAASEFLAKTEKSETSEMVCRQLQRTAAPGQGGRPGDGQDDEQSNDIGTARRGWDGSSPVSGFVDATMGSVPKTMGTVGGWRGRREVALVVPARA